MTKERLEKIKDSIDLQIKMAKIYGYSKDIADVLNEEKELYNYVIELENMKEEISEYIKDTIFWGVYEDIPMIDTKYGGEIEDILNKTNKE